MDIYTFTSSMVPLGPIMGLIAKAVWFGFLILGTYTLVHAFMRSLGWLLRRR